MYEPTSDYTTGFPYRPGDDWVKGQTPPPPKAEFAAPRPVLPRATGQEVGDVGDTVVNAARIAAVGASVYHGYRRTKSAGWAVAWGLFGGALPVLALPIAFAQGFGKRKRGSR